MELNPPSILNATPSKSNSDIKVGKFLRFGESLLLSSVDSGVQSEEATFTGFQAARNQPFFSVYDPTNPTGYMLETAPIVEPAGGSANLIMRNDPVYNYTTVCLA